MLKTFSKCRIKDYFIVWCFKIMFTSNFCWLFWCNFKLQHDMYENIKSLFVNLILLLLIIVLTNRVFQNYIIFEEIKTIFSFANEFLHHLQIKKNMFRVFFFRIIFVDELTRKIQRASSFNNWTMNLNHHIEYEKNIEIHDIWREILVKIDDKFSRKTFLMKHVDFAEMMNISLSKEWNSQITIMQILFSIHTFRSWVRWTAWQVIEIKNVAPFIWKIFAIYCFIIIFNCCNFFWSK